MKEDVIRFESPYLEKGFSEKVNKGRFLTYLAGPLITLVCAVFYASYMTGEHVRGKLNIIVHGFQNTSIETLLLSVAIGIPLSFALIYLLPRMHNAKRIILSLEFDGQKKELITQSRYIFEPEIIKEVIPYRNIRLHEKEKVYDAMARQPYQVLVVSRRIEEIGMLFRDHFTWDNGTLQSIESKLKEVST